SVNTPHRVTPFP
ncbi:hypothetical protein CPC197_1243, partial [Chlamydia psittaci C1/97]